MITILAVGKKHEDWILPGLERYQKRLKAPFNIEWKLIAHSSLEGDVARSEESDRLRAKLRGTDFVLLLDERGHERTSEAFATSLDRYFTASRNVVVIIGGAYGVDEALHSRADDVWSLSPLVFPHQLVRLILLEQVYRAQEITRGSGYHHV
jgi:23S rRNA (pseudouridine1915-N3)-methyltransferase